MSAYNNGAAVALRVHKAMPRPLTNPCNIQRKSDTIFQIHRDEGATRLKRKLETDKGTAEINLQVGVFVFFRVNVLQPSVTTRYIQLSC